VTENIPGLHGGLIAVQQVKIRTAYRTRGNLDDRVPRMMDLWVRNGVYTNVAFAMPAEGRLLLLKWLK
jgi:hypothetical protein